MEEITVVANQRGGVGKTVTSMNLGYSLKELGYKVLMVDFDSQANLSTYFGIENVNEIETNIAHLMMMTMTGEVLPPAEDYIIKNDGLDIIPSAYFYHMLITSFLSIDLIHFPPIV